MSRAFLHGGGKDLPPTDSPKADSRRDDWPLRDPLSKLELAAEPFLAWPRDLVALPPPDDNRFLTPLTSASDLSRRAERSLDGSTFVGPPLE